jgi:hypothetical protein
MANRKWTKTTYKTLHRKLKIEQLEPNKNQVWAHVLQKGKQFLLKMWHPSCSSSYKPSDKSWMHRNTSVDCPQIDLALYYSHDI